MPLNVRETATMGDYGQDLSFKKHQIFLSTEPQTLEIRISRLFYKDAVVKDTGLQAVQALLY